MAGGKAGPWVAGTIVGALALLLAAWFLGISPTLTAAEETKAQAEAQVDQNELLTIKIAGLKKQFVNLDQYKAERAAIQLQIPTTMQLADYQRQLATIAGAHQVTLVNLSVSSSLPVVPEGAVVAAPVVPADGTTDPAVDAAPVAAAPTGPAPIPGLSQIPVSLQVVGTYANVLAFLQDAQTGTTRILFVSGLDGVSQGQADEGNGLPATAPGDLSLTITASLYVLQPDPAIVVSAAPGDPAAAPAAPPVLPVPPADKNPFVPLS
ncbi:hypothetical protein [Cellulomonas sp.]|uniref:hypothetical protein n=1 Tax=Cellulomonas sp. TaxID=40001 RepID=UPI003BAD2AA1